MSSFNNWDDGNSFASEHNVPVAEETSWQDRRDSLSDGSVDPAMFSNMFNEEPLGEPGGNNSAANRPNNHGNPSILEHEEEPASAMKGTGGSVLSNNNTMAVENGHQMGSTFHETSETDTMGHMSNGLGPMQNGNHYTANGVIVTPHEMNGGGQHTGMDHTSSQYIMKQAPQSAQNGTAESNMAIHHENATTHSVDPSRYNQTTYSGFPQSQIAVPATPAAAHETHNSVDQSRYNQSAYTGFLQSQAAAPDALAAAHESMNSVDPSRYNQNAYSGFPQSQAATPAAAHETVKNEQEASHIQRDLEAVASMYNMDGQGHPSNSSTNNGGGEAVIELLDDDDYTQEMNSAEDHNNKRRKLTNGDASVDAATAAAAARRASMPDWMSNRSSQQPMQRKAVPIQRPTAMAPRPAAVPSWSMPPVEEQRQTSVIHEPSYIELPDGFVPKWDQLFPIQRRPQKTERRLFELSLLNVQEFTITGLPLVEGMEPTPVTGFRSKIKEICKPHGKSTFEKDKEGVGGKWRIPLGAYRTFYSWLNSDVMTKVIGIPESQLKIASLGKARLERGFPSVGKILSKGVPKGLATTLAPFQRGGVDFVAERNGRALIADEMGLGKTIQSIASLSMYWEEWPLLILTPSSARYHWENEFRHWLGADSPVNNDMGNSNGLDFGGEDESAEQQNDFDPRLPQARPMPLLHNSQINVLTSSKDPLFPNSDTRVVICSYGLAPTLVEKQMIVPGLFRCAIVDESHMLKNIKSQRTLRLVPILHATNRCILLSGTPAFARPSELLPQLKILSTEKATWWGDERLFVQKYVKRTSPARRAELFALLTGTIMIRRLKTDMLKSMPKKLREKVLTNVVSPEQRKEFHQCMMMLREGKGVLGQLARQHSALDTVDDHDSHAVSLSNEKSNPSQVSDHARAALAQQYQEQFQQRTQQLVHSLDTVRHQLDPTQQQEFIQQQQYKIRRELDAWYKEQLQQQEATIEEAEDSRKTVLNRMYTLTATAKIPFITEMIKRWLADPTKGKLCVFAHHKFVLNDLINLTGLSNESGSTTRYIRIDGSTSPKLRQAQINAFQTDPDVKIAILGITAAGVAVTLTASSTVWFTELFWTPALMIQAEDRCHRIGQNARVKCLYFVAKGTLDELLWKLLERKFRDLGEFVEGQEKMKIVVDKTYHGEKEFRSIFSKPEDDDIPDDAMDFGDIDGEDTGESLFDLDEDIEGDITMLGNEEITRTFVPGGDDDGQDPESKMASGTGAQSKPAKKPILGSSEDDAIALLSDDEDEQPSTTANGNTQSAAFKTEKVVSSANGSEPAKPTRNRCYNQIFDGPKFEMLLALYNGRPIVSQRNTRTPSRPAIADILVAVNGTTLPVLLDMNQITQALKKLIAKGPVELTFMDSAGWTSHLLQPQAPQRSPQHRVANSMQNQGSDEIIELSDDDD
ncbi:unnamed protein product [Cylindrotheca closterium]|uniref:Uncharacterized protein n=1 Tax=Cylindrotheca closterium TaxID=2856 RepID=A0AAD2CBM2_9STRA|nr:unnamed protein product [Cylindrotheca closterium]